MLKVLVEELMDYHAGVLDNMNSHMKESLLSYAMEITVQIALCEENRKAWDLYYSAYSLPHTYEHIKGWAADKNYTLFSERLPHWTEQDFRNTEAVASGIEFAALKTFCDRNFTLDKKVSLFLDSLMMLYEVSKEERREIIDAILKTDYCEVARDMFEKFIKRLDNDVKEIY